MLDSSESRTILDIEISLTLIIHTTHTQTRAFFRRLQGPAVQNGRPSVQGGGGYVRAPSIIAHRAAKLPDLCPCRRGGEHVKDGSAGGVSKGLGAVAGSIWLTCDGS